MNRLNHKVAIVTASTRGIGLAIAETFIKENATVYMAVRNLERGFHIAENLNRAGYGEARTVYCDASQLQTYELMIDEVIANEGRIDILVNNYGGTDPKVDQDIFRCQYSDFVNGVALNLASVFLPTQIALTKAMKKQQSGSIINISSLAGLTPDLSQCAYGTAKAGIIHLSKMIAVQAARYNIRCNVVCPGMTATDAVEQNTSNNFRTLFCKHTPLKRMASPEEIAAAVLYFAEDSSAFTTGQVLAITGGIGLATPLYGDIIGAKTAEEPS